jgi:hypothetical protein
MPAVAAALVARLGYHARSAEWLTVFAYSWPKQPAKPHLSVGHCCQPVSQTSYLLSLRAEFRSACPEFLVGACLHYGFEAINPADNLFAPSERLGLITRRPNRWLGRLVDLLPRAPDSDHRWLPVGANLSG